jgi:hypothetical protein
VFTVMSASCLTHAAQELVQFRSDSFADSFVCLASSATFPALQWHPPPLHRMTAVAPVPSIHLHQSCCLPADVADLALDPGAPPLALLHLHHQPFTQMLLTMLTKCKMAPLIGRASCLVQKRRAALSTMKP